MRKGFFAGLLLVVSGLCQAQKKPLDHSVYDGWQSVGEKMISRDGQWIVYTIDSQEGDRLLVIQGAHSAYHKTIERGYGAQITADSRFLVCKIAPLYKQTREAKIKKKKPEEMPKDSLAVVYLGDDHVWKRPAVRSFAVPDKGSDYLVYQLERSPDAASKARNGKMDARRNDSLMLVIDSLRNALRSLSPKSAKDQGEDAEGDESATAPAETSSDLVIKNFNTGTERVYHNVMTYLVSERGNKLVFRQSPPAGDSTARAAVVLMDLAMNTADTISLGGNDFKAFAFSKDGRQLAFLAERDARPKELTRFYKLWYYKEGADSARALVEKNSVGMQMGMTVSEFGKPEFSKSGNRLLFGTSPVQPPKDTTLVEMDLAKLDVWNYNDDFLQPVQLNRLTRDLQVSYLAVVDPATSTLRQLGSPALATVYPTGEGDGKTFIGVSDAGMRIESQWTGTTNKDLYVIDVATGNARLVKKAVNGVINASYISSTGKYLLWYDLKARNYFIFDGDSVRNLTRKIQTPLYSEEYDQPSDPTPYNVMGWHQGDSAVYINDRYDVWKINLIGSSRIESLTRGLGRKEKISWYPLVRDATRKYYRSTDRVLFKRVNQLTKEEGMALISMDGSSMTELDVLDHKYSAPTFITDKMVSDSNQFLLTRESFVKSPDLYLFQYPSLGQPAAAVNKITLTEQKLSSINPQQKEYNWGSSELHTWTTFNGRRSTGILYKPEDFDPSRKYPLILYFYEKLSDGLYTYHPPLPTPSRLNISFYVSRGYLVFAPDIRYTIGHPARSAYDYIVSAAKDLAKNPWVDATRMGIQGQSWGGIQVAQLITMTDIFKAAWAGAPVANMTSAYGGIRWESGSNRQFQYERTQSRIGATLWEKPQLYIENSPLFSLPKVNTPLVIMSNDADGAVPWYQGIELFTALRRLDKKVWLLNYNGEAHNLVQRRNRKDIQIRQQQYFDWLLKGDKPAVWLTTGVPAVKKGKDWGLEPAP